MNKTKGLIVIGLMAITAIAALAMQGWQEVTIKSEKGRREYKRVDHNGRVRLVRELKGDPCVEGRTWGFDRDGIWVDGNCRAVFEYQRSENRDRDVDRLRDLVRPGQYETKVFKLRSERGRRETRRIDTSGGIKLLRRLTDAPCQLGRSWGYDANSVWVDNDCQAEFEVRSRKDNGRNRDDWFSGNGVPNWARGDWEGYGRPADGYTMTIRSDGSLRLSTRRNANEIRGEVRGNRVEIGDDVYRLEKLGDNGIRFIPIRAASGAMSFRRN